MARRQKKNPVLDLLQLLVAISFLYPLMTMIFYLLYIFSPKTNHVFGGVVKNMGNIIGKVYMDSFSSPLLLLATLGLGILFTYLMVVVGKKM
ncbi:hypothetical protein HQN89_28445 [Paenibacillus frigoriresistens]|uniref:hypothetical protein n=1 Tax=Paenibacillus alginolyticus TaxID=59839 RepID=UPI0015638E50|nr:hypothetical protein [Paenibacillus frigoriresistens]NRF94825.1 hypothetical protein [Paenibacillus frigoriresistens]